MNRWRLLITVLFMLAMSGMWYLGKDTPPARQAEQSDTSQRPDYVAVNLQRTVYDKDGRRTQSLSARKMTYYERENRAEFEAPQFTLESKTNQGSRWQISAQSGILHDNRTLLLNNDVDAVNSVQTDFINRIQGENFAIDIEATTMTSEHPVKMTGDGILITGSGMATDLNTKQIDLIKHAQTIFQNRQQD